MVRNHIPSSTPPNTHIKTTMPTRVESMVSPPILRRRPSIQVLIKGIAGPHLRIEHQACSVGFGTKHVRSPAVNRPNPQWMNVHGTHTNPSFVRSSQCQSENN